MALSAWVAFPNAGEGFDFYYADNGAEDLNVFFTAMPAIRGGYDPKQRLMQADIITANPQATGIEKHDFHDAIPWPDIELLYIIEHGEIRILAPLWLEPTLFEYLSENFEMEVSEQMGFDNPHHSAVEDSVYLGGTVSIDTYLNIARAPDEPHYQALLHRHQAPFRYYNMMTLEALENQPVYVFLVQYDLYASFTHDADADLKNEIQNRNPPVLFTEIEIPDRDFPAPDEIENDDVVQEYAVLFEQKDHAVEVNHYLSLQTAELYEHLHRDEGVDTDEAETEALYTARLTALDIFNDQLTAFDPGEQTVLDTFKEQRPDPNYKSRRAPPSPLD